MSFYQKINEIIQYCNKYQQEVEVNDLALTEPYQSNYLQINKILKVYSDKRLEVEALSAGEQSAPGMANLTPARKEYYDLEPQIPSFLASGEKHYYYLQTYKIACMHLIKTFSYSSFKGDWEKINNLSNWLVEIKGQQEQYNAKSSIQKSLENIKELGDFSALDQQNLQQLKEEVCNIQMLLAKEPELQDNLETEDVERFKQAVDFLKENEELLEEFPKLEDEFTFEEPPILEVISYRCKQLIVLVDYFHKKYASGKKVKELTDFKQELRHSFDLSINVCEDIHNAMLKAMGGHQKPRLKTLCQMLHKALEPFADEQKLFEQYDQRIFADYLEVGRGIPDTIDLETHLLTSLGQNKSRKVQQ